MWSSVFIFIFYYSIYRQREREIDWSVAFLYSFKIFCNFVFLYVCLSVCPVCLSVCLSPENSDLHLSYFAEFVCYEVLDRNSLFCFVLFLRCILVCRNYLYTCLTCCCDCHQEQICKEAGLCLNLYPSVIKYYLILLHLPLSVSLSLSVFLSLFSVSVTLSLCISLSLSLSSLFLPLCLCLSVSLCLSLSLCLCLSVCLSVCLSICLSVSRSLCARARYISLLWY